MKLNIACGFEHLEGYLNCDLNPGCNPDRIMDALEFPWKFPSNTVSEILVSHFLEHIPHSLRNHPNREGLTVFMEECYRVLLPTGILRVKFPFAFSQGGVADPTHQRYMVPTTMMYYSKKWREANNLHQYDIKTDFSCDENFTTREYIFKEAPPVPLEMLINRVYEVDMNLVCHKPMRA